VKKKSSTARSVSDIEPSKSPWPNKRRSERRGTAIAWGAVMVQQAICELSRACEELDKPGRRRVSGALADLQYAGEWLDDALAAGLTMSNTTTPTGRRAGAVREVIQRPLHWLRFVASLSTVGDDGDSPWANRAPTVDDIALLDVEVLERQQRGEYAKLERVARRLMAERDAPETSDEDLVRQMKVCEFTKEERRRLLAIRDENRTESATWVGPR
jgi:hypothetical protein